MERNRIDEKSRKKASGAAVMRPELTQALYRALFEEWAEFGYTGISLERVAARASAGKAAIYRRWPTKLAFVSEAVETIGVAYTDVSDHGSLSDDTRAFLLMLRRVLRHRLVRRILPDMYAERARSGELAPLLDRVAKARRELGDAILERAIARGELKRGINRELARDLLPSPLFWRMIVLGKRVSRQEINEQVHALLAALVAM